jgi:uncharacterized protein (TIGR03382 family)
MFATTIFGVALFGLTACDMTAPKVLSFDPADGELERGVRSFDVDIAYEDESDVTVKLLLDGVKLGEATTDCDHEECTATAQVPTSGIDAGDHVLAAVLEDSSGNETKQTHDVWIDDVLVVTEMEVHGITDSSGTLEMEVYAFDDDTGELVGCTGGRHGLNVVDVSDVDYANLTSMFIDPQGYALISKDFADRRVRLEVWEDDDDPVCPTIPSPTGNSLIAATEPMSAQDMRDLAAPMTLTDVPELGIAWTRDLDADPGIDPGPPDKNWDGDLSNGGCSAAGSPGLLVALALLMTKRRRRRKRAVVSN